MQQRESIIAMLRRLRVKPHQWDAARDAIDQATDGALSAVALDRLTIYALAELKRSQRQLRPRSPAALAPQD